VGSVGVFFVLVLFVELGDVIAQVLQVFGHQGGESLKGEKGEVSWGST
jgi:hypothetical protein